MTEADARRQLVELAERCEAAEGASWELDTLIRCAAFAPAGAYVGQSPINGAWCVYSGTETRSGRPRLFEHWPSHEVRTGEFTASIDAALTLVPEGWEWTIESGGHVEMTASRLRGPQVEGNASTPALALCSAALRARASQ